MRLFCSGSDRRNDLALPPIAMRDVSRDWRGVFFAFHHAFSQPLNPFRPSLAIVLPANRRCIGQQFFPRYQNRSAKEIVDDVDSEFPVKKQNADRLPRGRDMNHQVLAVWSQYLSDFFGTSAIRQFDDSAQSSREGRTLKGLDQVKHRVAPAAAAVMMDLRSRENDAGSNGDRVDQIGEG